MSLAIVTLTRGQRPAWLLDCARSVRENKPANSVHIVSTCTGDFQRRRFETTVNNDAKYVAWVDDDDMVVGDALARCVEALETTGVGLAFTREGRMNAEGVPGKPREVRQVTRRDIAMHPRSAHHLAVVRKSCLAPILLEQAEHIGTGIDWLMRAYAGLIHGAVQVPMVGYLWRAHPGQESSTGDWNARYEQAMPTLRMITKGWMGAMDAPVPLFEAATA